MLRNSNNIKRILQELNYKHLAVYDKNYHCPSKRWVLGKFRRWYKRRLWWLRVSKWRKNFDCDDFATGYRWLMSVYHSQRPTGSQGISVASVVYYKDNGNCHAINLVILDNSLIIFIEPLTGEEVKLTTREQASIRDIRM